MRTFDQAGDADRTAANPAALPAGDLPSVESPAVELPAVGLPAVERRAEEFSARRRGAIRNWFHRHPRIMDVVVVLVYLVAGSGTFLGPQPDMNVSAHFVIVGASAIVLLFRRDKPLAVLAILSIFELLHIVMVPNTGDIGISVWFALYAVAVVYRPLLSFPLAVVASIPLSIYLFFLYQPPAEYLVAGGPTASETNVISSIIMLLANIIATGIGASVRSGRRHEDEMRQWAVKNAQLASVAERNRIAREMHDVVAHSLTVMVALSDGAAVVVKRDPAKAGEVLGQLSDTGRTALADMRRVLGVLRAEGGTLRSPQPVQTDMGALIEGFRQAGLPITFASSGPTARADPALELTVYRIVQESLTNVLRYGAAVSRVRVDLENDLAKGELTVRITDDGHGSLDGSLGTGRGIQGMRERAGIFAGTLVAGPLKNGGWRVEAILYPANGPEL